MLARKRNENLIKQRIVVFFMLIFLTIPFFALLKTTIVKAGSSEYSNVLEDLNKSSDFDIDNYTFNKNDYSLHLITIAESVDNELFIYVYQPSAEFYHIRATSISMAIKEETSLNYKIYDLIFLNSNGVFYKYLVNNFNVKNTSEREYEISEIFRTFNDNFGDVSVDNNIVNEIAYPVNKHFKFTNSTLSVSDLDYIKVTDKYVGFVRYFGGSYNSGSFGSSLVMNESCDSHFVAFSTDKNIDKLLEADIYYQSQEVVDTIVLDTFGEIKDNYSYITSEQIAYYHNDGFFGTTFDKKWYRIQKVEDFLKGEDFNNVYQCGPFNVTDSYTFNDTAKQEISKMKWVLRFAETEFLQDKLEFVGTGYYIISNVSLLRLKYETDGLIFELGVVDNKQSSSGVPDNSFERSIEIETMFLIILILLFVIIFIPVLTPILKLIFNGVGLVLKVGFKIVFIPFKLLGKLFKSKNDDYDDS